MKTTTISARRTLFEKWRTKGNPSKTTLAPPPLSSLAPLTLTDEKELEKVRPYMERLEEALNNPGITNVALTGNYGSGKSTILRTFFHQNPQIRHFKVSLASFNLTDAADDENLERRLEISILQQLFYHVHPERIPDSRFKRITNLSTWRLAAIAIGTTAWLMSSFALFSFDYFKKLNPATWDPALSFDYWAFLFAILFFSGIGLLAKTIARLVANSKINKLTIKGEIELGEDEKKSVFNQHLEEIIYFFERTDYRVIVIEDLDRFNNTEIFTKIREINILLNNAESIGREIVFLYAIRDELFMDKKDRVKFFDYIIPVISFINPSNAGEQLAKLVNSSGLQGILSKEFTEDIITFIDDIDMRLLKNMFHEYRIYKDILDPSLNQDQLFSVILYKNLYPNDFGELIKRSGKLYRFLSKKQQYMELLTAKLTDELNELNQRLTIIESQQGHIHSVKELRIIYIQALLTEHPQIQHFYLNDKTLSLQEILEDDWFSLVLNAEKLSFRKYSTDTFGRPRFIDDSIRNPFGVIQKRVHPDYTYDQRVAIIEGRETTKRNALRQQRDEAERKLQDQQSWLCQTIFKEIDIQPHLSEFEGNDLVRNLLINGYINEQYNDYLSLFHGVNLTRKDFVFERNVRSGIVMPFDTELENVGNLITKIRLEYFSREVILNRTICNYMLEIDKTPTPKLHAMIKQLANEKPRSIEFIDDYIENGAHRGKFIRLLCRYWNGFWNFLQNKYQIEKESANTKANSKEKEKINKYLQLIIRYGAIEDLKAFNGMDSFVTYLETYENFLYDYRDITVSRIEKLLTELNVKFEKLEYVEPTVPHLQEVYRNNNYRITNNNLNNLIVAFGKYESKEPKPPTYTWIRQSGCKPMIDYVGKNLPEYIERVYDKFPEAVQEKEEDVARLLNAKTLTLSHKTSIIQKQVNAIKNVALIESADVYPLLFEQDKVAASWSNILSYYTMLLENVPVQAIGIPEEEDLEEEYIEDEEEGEADEITDENEEETPFPPAFSAALIAYLNDPKHSQLLSTHKIRSRKHEQHTDRFIREMLLCTELNTESYTLLLKALPKPVNKLRLPFAKMPAQRIALIIQSGLLSWDENTFLYLQEVTDLEHLRLLEHHSGALKKLLETYTFDTTDAFLLLKSSRLSPEEKHLIVRQAATEMIPDPEMVDILCRYWPENDPPQIGLEQLKKLLQGGSPAAYKIKLINQYNDLLSNTDLTALVSALKENYREIFTARRRPVFERTEYHWKLFGELKKRGLINNILPTKNDKLKVIARQ